MWGKRKCAKMFDRMPEGQDHCELKYCWNNNIKIYAVERVFYVSRECGIKLTQNGCQRLAILIVAMDTQLLYKVRTFSLCCTTYLTIRCEIVPLWFQCSVTIGHNKVHAWISRQHVDVINAENVTINFTYSYTSVYGLSV